MTQKRWVRRLETAAVIALFGLGSVACATGTQSGDRVGTRVGRQRWGSPTPLDSPQMRRLVTSEDLQATGVMNTAEALHRRVPL